MHASNLAVVAQDLRKEFLVASQHGWRGLVNPCYKQKVAVNGATLRIAHGEAVAIIGPNGAGKSTFLRMLNGVLEPTAGTVEVLGMTPHTQRRKLALRLSVIVGDRSQLRGGLPLTDNLRLAGEIYRVPDIERRIAELIGQFDMERYRKQRVGELSAGQRRRVTMARALMHDPDLLLLDEPTDGLDVVGMDEFRTLVRRLHSLGKTVIVTSHNVGDLEALADRAVVINDGAVVFDDTMEQLRTRYSQHDIVRLTVPALQGGSMLPHALTVLGITPTIDLVNGVATYELGGAVSVHLFTLAAHKVPFTGIQSERVSLEEAIRRMFRGVAT